MIKENQLKKKICKEKLEKKINIVTKIFLFFFLFIFVSACSKETLTDKTFTSKMENKKYSVIDISENKNKTILAVGEHYQVYFYSFEETKTLTETIKKEINSLKTGDNKIKHTKKDNVEMYEISNSNIYTVYYIIDNTYLYISTTKNYQNDVQSLLKDLGY